MNEQFSKVKANRKQVLKQLQQAALDSDYEIRADTKLSQHRVRDRVSTALAYTGEKQLLTSFNECNARQKCQLVWCESCRQDVANQTLKRWLRHIDVEQNTNSDFLHITGILGIANVDAREVQALIDDDANNWKSIRRRIKDLAADDYKFIDVAYEFELLNATYLRNSDENDFKKKQIQQLWHRDKKLSQYTVFVHFHGITNLTKHELDKVVGKRYWIDDEPILKMNQVNGLYVQSLYSRQSLEKNLWKMSSYCFKSATRFKHSYRGNDIGKELMTAEELSSLIVLYREVQGRQYRGLFREAKNRDSRDDTDYDYFLSLIDEDNHAKRY